MAREGMPLWSFNQGMGQNIFPVGYTDPFSLYIILMGKNFVYYSIFYAEVFKIFCAGFFFYLFLKKINLTDYTAITGGILYSFAGYVIVGGTWISFSTQAVYIALLLYSFEKLYQDDNWILFPVSIFLIASYQPLDLYFIGAFLVIYIIFRLFENDEKEQKIIFSLLAKIVFLSVAAVAMGAFFIINGVQVMIESPRVSGDASYFNALFSKQPWAGEGVDLGETHYLTALMRFFSCDILGTGDNFRGWNNYLEAPLFYCGLISLVLFPHFLSIGDRRKKIVYFALIVILISPVVFPYLRYSYWLFTGNYYRVFSFFVAIVILLIGLKSIDNIDLKSKTDIKITAVTLCLLLLFLYYPYKNSQIIDKNIRDIVTVFLIIYSALVYLLQFKKIKNIVKVLILSAVVIELICLYNPSVNKRPVISGNETMEKVNYNDYTVDAVAFIKSHDKSFFRINKGYYSIPFLEYVSLNDAKVQDFYGTPSYNSFNQLNYIKFLQTMEIVREKKELDTRWSIGLSRSPLLHSFASIKYTLAKEQKPIILDFAYDEIAKNGDVRILENKYSLPLGFTYEKYIPLKDFKILPKDQRMYVLYKAVVIDESLYKDFDGLEKLDVKEIPKYYLVNEYIKDIELLRKNTLNISKHKQNIITGEINLDKNKMLFFSIPFDKGWNIKVDGKSVNAMKVNIGFIGVPVEKGLHKIELSFLPLYYYIGAAISLIAIFLFGCLIAFKCLRNKKYN
ncbi:abc transporter, permease protein [hydrocarbon metagenome]|uniref:Abc transporter, permease protein n=1 Tax=hydrocarbon metagenome TaxID=938273 RepID=A0A0W8FV22_9ZZZZ